MIDDCIIYLYIPESCDVFNGWAKYYQGCIDMVMHDYNYQNALLRIINRKVMEHSGSNPDYKVWGFFAKTY